MSPTLAYRLLLWLLLPAVAVATFAVASRDGSVRYLRQRFGHFPSLGAAADPVWVHCASVGETNTALALIEAWLRRKPDDSFVLTTNTITAAGILESQPESIAARVRHCYLPLDYPLFCRRFLDAVHPRCAWIMETEIWLNLLRACHEKNIPVFMVNARLSRRTLVAAAHISSYYRRSLSLVRKIFARGEKDAAAFAGLGARADRIEVIGNLKFAVGIVAGRHPPLPNLIGTRYVLAASTHADEEIQVAQVWRSSRQANDGDEEPLLVIAPRHPQRGGVIEKQLHKRGFSTQRRSRSKQPQQQTSVYIADTIGELPALIQHAEMVFMGGSLVPVGGHNVLEPAKLGVPQAVGPHTDNFQEEIEALQKVNGIIRVNDAQALEKVFRDAVQADPAHARAAQNALGLMQQCGNIAATYAEKIAAALEEVRPG